MKKTYKFILLITLVFANFSVASPKSAFTGYKSAILEQQGKKAANLVTTTTLEEYQRYVDAAKYATKEEMKELSFLTRFQALIIRHRVPLNLLKEMNGKDAFVYAVNNDWIGKSGVIPMTIANIETSGTRAISDAYHNEQKLPYKFIYKKENEEWKFDLTQILMNTETPLRMAAKQAKMEEDDFIFLILETVSGTKPTQSLWIPKLKR